MFKIYHFPWPTLTNYFLQLLPFSHQLASLLTNDQIPESPVNTPALQPPHQLLQLPTQVFQFLQTRLIPGSAGEVELPNRW